MRKPVLSIAAIALFLFYNYSLYQWIQSGHSFKNVWQAATSDWFLAVTILDMSIFTLLCLIWLYRDMQQRNCSGRKKFLILLTTMIIGVVVSLLYFAVRKEKRLE